jgi:hypothetical protein
MRQSHDDVMISGLFCNDFLSRPFVKQTVMIPWFYLEAHIRDDQEFVREMLMVSSLDALKDIIELQNESFLIHSIQYVTPGYMNGTDQWKMEQILEASEAHNQSGELVTLFQVPERTYSQMEVITEINFQKIKVLFSFATK